MPTVTLTFSPLLAHVRTARMVAVGLARRAGVDETVCDEVRLAVGEACSRAVALHAAHAPAQPVEMLVTDDDHFVVRVRDWGPAGAETPADFSGGATALVDPPALRAPADDPPDAVDPAEGGTLSELLPEGFELAVVAGLVDQLAVDTRTDGSGTDVVMTWTDERSTTPSTAAGAAPAEVSTDTRGSRRLEP